MPTIVQRLAAFAQNTTYEQLSDAAREQLKIRVLDSLGCALGALEGEPIRMLRAHLEEFDYADHCTLIGGGRAAPHHASLFGSALVRYLDFNDSYLAKGETCHPSDNLGAVLAAAEYAERTGRAGASGKDLLAALALAYQVQCRLSDEAPVRAKGFDHTVQGQYAAAAGVSRALGLSEEQTAHAIAISATAHNALRVTRTGALSHWKGLAYPETAFTATHSALLAMRGITGPPEVFEGNKGFMHSIAGDFAIDWQSEDLERVTKTIIKRFNAEIHSQPALEAALELKEAHDLISEDIGRVEVETFDVAYDIIGGGEEGEKKTIRTKEEADHSLPYMTAAMLLDGAVLPAQYVPERIEQDDVQNLLQKVEVRERAAYSARFPEEMPTRLRVHLKGGRLLEKEKDDYEGFHTRPMTWATVREKFEQLARPAAGGTLAGAIVGAVANLEALPVSRLTGLLAHARSPSDPSS